MPPDIIPVRLTPALDVAPPPAAPLGQRRDCPQAPAVEPLLDRADRWLIDMAELAHLTSRSVRHLRRLDSSRDIPGRVAIGRRVLFQTEIIREWVRAGLPDREQWAMHLKRNGKR